MREKPVILMAEHQSAVLRSLSMLLIRSGYNVVASSDAAEVVEKVDEYQPDLLLIDRQIPGVDALDVIRQVRSTAKLAVIPVIVLSASSHRDDVVAAARAGANYYIARNAFSTREFLARVADLISRNKPDASAAGACDSSEQFTRKACHLQQAANLPELACRVPPISLSNLHAWAKDITQLRALPFVMPRVLALTNSQYSSADSLVATIQQDVALASKVLAMANSSMYRRGRDPITSLKQAVRNIGFGSVRQAALGLSLIDLFGQPGGCGGIDRLAFWEHSFASASIASLLASRANMDQAQAFVVGLLHGLGRLIFDDFLTQDYAALLKLFDSDRPLPADLERSWMGVESAHLGEIVLREWHMPAELYEPIGDHRLPLAALLNKPEPRRRWAGLVKLADQLTTCLGFGDRRVCHLMHLDNELVDDFAVEDSFLNEIRDAIPGQLQELKLAMLLHLPRAGLTQRPVRISDRPTLYLCSRPPHLDILEYCLRLRHRRMETLTSVEALVQRLEKAEDSTVAIVNLLPVPFTDRTVETMDRWLARRDPSRLGFTGMVLARPDQLDQLAGPFGRAFDGLLSPVPANRLERLLGLASPQAESTAAGRRTEAAK